MHRLFEGLRREIERDFPSTEVRLKLFPSGAALMDIKVGAETFVLEYHAEVGVGLNRASKAVFGWEGYELPFDSFQAAREYVLSLLSQNTD
jgi:hypothetical protein